MRGKNILNKLRRAGSSELPNPERNTYRFPVIESGYLGKNALKITERFMISKVNNDFKFSFIYQSKLKDNEPNTSKMALTVNQLDLEDIWNCLLEGDLDHKFSRTYKKRIDTDDYTLTLIMYGDKKADFLKADFSAALYLAKEDINLHYSFSYESWEDFKTLMQKLLSIPK